MEWSPRRIVNRIVSDINAPCTAVSTPESQIIDLPSVSLSQRRRPSEPVKTAPSRSPTIRYPLKCSQAAIRTTSNRWTCLTVCLVPTSDTHSTCKLYSTLRSEHSAWTRALLVVLQRITVSNPRLGNARQLCGGDESDRRASFLRRTERAEFQECAESPFPSSGSAHQNLRAVKDSAVRCSVRKGGSVYEPFDWRLPSSAFSRLLCSRLPGWYFPLAFYIVITQEDILYALAAEEFNLSRPPAAVPSNRWRRENS